MRYLQALVFTSMITRISAASNHQTTRMQTTVPVGFSSSDMRRSSLLQRSQTMATGDLAVEIIRLDSMAVSSDSQIGDRESPVDSRGSEKVKYPEVMAV